MRGRSRVFVATTVLALVASSQVAVAQSEPTQVGTDGGSGGTRYRVRRAMDINGQQAFVLFDLEQLGVIP